MKLVLVKPRLSYEIGPHNFDLLTRLLAPVADGLGPDDIVLLPEHTVVDGSRDHYRDGVSQLARRLGCHVVGGSHHEDRGHDRVNAGAVSDASGQIIGEYEKLRPYADERGRVRSGGALGEVTIGGRRLLVLICADFWFSDVFPRAAVLPDLVLVPAHSVSRKPTPLYSRELWRHLSIARAYELGVYVGVSDWDFTEVPGMLSPSGVSG
ncbi:MAG: carbon-nitrogen hydrolase family protein, partial [Polyangiales bacterium]